MNLYPTVDAMEETGDATGLSSREDYIRYFQVLKKAFVHLSRWYTELAVGGDMEQAAIAGFVEKILYTVKTLELRHVHDPSLNLVLDLNDSGYPHILTIGRMEADLATRDRQLNLLLPKAAIKDQMIDHMLRYGEEPEDLKWQMAQRLYIEALDPDKVIHHCVPGDLTLLEKTSRVSRFLFPWFCYDVKSNIPYVHLMLFEYDNDAPELAIDSPAYLQFLEVVHNFGSSIPDRLSLLSADIDRKLSAVHPKIIKRIRLGPLLTRFVRDSEVDQPIIVPLKTYGEADDFVLLIKNEISVSRKQQEITDSWLEALIGGKVREIFAVNEFDLECSEAGATEIQKHIILPHTVMQNVDFRTPPYQKYARYHKVCYSEGEMYAV